MREILRRRSRCSHTIPGILFLTASLLLGSCSRDKAPTDIVATFSAGNVTTAQLEKAIADHLGKPNPSESSKGAGTPAAEDPAILKRKEFYLDLIDELVLREVVVAKVKEKQLDTSGNIRDALKHVEEEFTIDQFHEELHGPGGIRIDQAEIQDFYVKNKERFGDATLAEATEGIRSILQGRKEAEYIATYVDDLMEKASVSRFYELLRLPEPTDDDLLSEYASAAERFREPEKYVVEEIAIAALEKESAGKRAKKASDLLSSGESFVDIAKKYGIGGVARTREYVAGEAGAAIDAALSSLSPGTPSLPIQVDDTFVILILKEKKASALKTFDVVKEEIRRGFLERAEAELLKSSSDRTLFTIHGRRYTLGDFYQEFNELPAVERDRYREYDQSVLLVDAMIKRLVLLEDSYERLLNTRNADKLTQEQQNLLASILHREEVDRNVEVSEEEIKKYYDKNKDRFRIPGRDRIRLIFIRGDDTKKASDRAQEAYAKLKKGPRKGGSPFEEIARAYSEDPVTAGNGGLVDGWIGESGDYAYEMQMHELHEIIRRLRPGVPSKPMEIMKNYFIFQVEERREGRRLTFAEAQDAAAREIENVKHEDATKKMSEGLLKEANVVVNRASLDAVMKRYRGSKTK